MYLDLFTASQPQWANICSHTIIERESSVITNSINIECWWIKYRDTGVSFPWLSLERKQYIRSPNNIDNAGE